jgi:hypothetical protein
MEPVSIVPPPPPPLPVPYTVTVPEESTEYNSLLVEVPINVLPDEGNVTDPVAWFN